MPTRFYLSHAAPDITPAFGDGTNSATLNWSNVTPRAASNDANIDRARAVTTTLGNALANHTAINSTGGATVEFDLVRQYVSDALNGQTISGNVSGVIRCFESSTNLNATLAIGIRLVDSAGVHKSWLLQPLASDLTTSTPPEMAASPGNTRCFNTTSETASLALTQQTAALGDRLVIEIGFRKSNTTTSRTATLRFGDSAASDFALTDALATDLNPWVEFSQDLSFQIPPLTVNLASTPVTGATSVVVPTVQLGSLTLNLGTVPLTAATTVVAPTVTIVSPTVAGRVYWAELATPAPLAPLTVDLTSGPAAASSTALGAEVVLGSLTLSLAAISANTSSTDPTVVIGATTVDLTASPVTSAPAAVAPSVVLATVTWTPSASTAATSVVDPTVSGGPTVAGRIYWAELAAPVAGGPVTVDLTASPATAATSVVAPSVAGGAGTPINVNGATTYQTVDGLGWHISAYCGQYSDITPVLDDMARNGSLFAVDPQARTQWAPNESDVQVNPYNFALNTTMRQVFEGTYAGSWTNATNETRNWSLYFPAFWAALRYLYDRGKPVVVTCQGHSPKWAGTETSIDQAKENSFARMIVSMVHYGRSIEGLPVTLLSILNETDLGGGYEGPNVGSVQYNRILTQVRTELDSLGYTDVKFVPPQSAHGIGLGTDINSDAQNKPRVQAWSRHSYDVGMGADVDTAVNYWNRPLWVTEYGTFTVAPGDLENGSDVSDADQWTYAQVNGMNLFEDILAAGAGGALCWEGVECLSHKATWSYNGYWSYSNHAETGGGTYAAKKRYWVTALLYRAIPTGWHRIAASCTDANLTVQAYTDGAGGVSVVGYNGNASNTTYTVNLSNLTSPSTVYHRESTTTEDRVTRAIMAGGSSFSATITGHSFFVLTSVPVLAALINLAGSPASSQTSASGAQIPGGLSRSVDGAQPGAAGALASAHSIARTTAGLEPAPTGGLARLWQALRSLAGSQPSASGTVARIRQSATTVAGAQPAAAGAQSNAKITARGLGGAQPNATGALQRLWHATRSALAGVQPSATAALTRLWHAQQSTAGAQPGPSGSLSYVQHLHLALGGTQPPGSGAIVRSAHRTASLTGAEPAATGAVGAIAGNLRNLSGTQPSPSGVLTRSRHSEAAALSGLQASAAGLLARARSSPQTLAGASPGAAGILLRLWQSFRSSSGAQPAASGALLRSYPWQRTTAGQQAAPSGDVFAETGGRYLVSAQPPASGTLAHLVVRRRLLAGLEPAPSGASLPNHPHAGVQPAATGTLAVHQVGPFLWSSRLVKGGIRAWSSELVERGIRARLQRRWQTALRTAKE